MPHPSERGVLNSGRKEKLRLLTANANTWSSMQVLLEWLESKRQDDDASFQVHGIAAQELRLREPEKVLAAQSWAWQRNFRLSLNRADRVGEAELAVSAGTGFLSRSDIAAAPVELGTLAQYASRVFASTINIGLPFGLLVVSAYFKDGLGASGFNLDLLEKVGEWLLAQRRPWLLMGDFNMSPSALASTGWLERVAGVVLAPGGYNCFQG